MSKIDMYGDTSLAVYGLEDQTIFPALFFIFIFPYFNANKGN